MAISNELMLAVLAMDAYNRGYNAGIGNNSVGLGISGQIGNATIAATSLNLGQTGGVRNDVAASFFGISYTYNGQIVIAYRGTDNYNLWQDNDITTGWVTGAGFIGTQANLAQAFFKPAIIHRCAAANDNATLQMWRVA